MGKTIEKNCKRCGASITVKLSVHKRGFGKFCSRSCSALDRTQREQNFTERTLVSFEEEFEEITRGEG